MPRSVLVLSLVLAVIAIAGALWYFLIFPIRWYFRYLRRRSPQAAVGRLLIKAMAASQEVIAAAIESTQPEERQEISREIEGEWFPRIFITAIVFWSLTAIVIAARALL
jgi:uncharacterized membrane protein